GDITKADGYSAEPFGNTVVTGEMTLTEIAQLILNKFNSAGKESHTLDLYPSGIEYSIITDGQGYATDIFFEFTPHDPPGGKYTVALSDYVDSVYKYAHTGSGRDTRIRIAAAAEKYISALSPVSPDDHIRVKIE
ncbi:MAG: hypothetical protein LIO77_01875, partial [Rikenellaceae bacterium]|nr:hypothetical protein [Rikenellaceae bacterium]